jgi:hypothetical protein
MGVIREHTGEAMPEHEGVGGASTTGTRKRARARPPGLLDKLLPDITGKGSALRKIRPGYRAGVEVEGPVFFLSLSDELQEALVAEGLRHDLSLMGLIMQALQLVARKGLEPLVAASNRDAET